MSHRSISDLLLVVVVGGIYATTLLWAASAAAPVNAAAPLRIGIILPLTSPMADVAKSALTGAQVAVDEINSVGGYLGRPVELVVEDDKANPDTGLRAAETIVQNSGAFATVGLCNTSVAIKVSDFDQASKHPLIVTCASGSSIGENVPSSQSYTFRLAANSQIQTQFLVSELQRLKYRRVVILADNTPTGDAGVKDLEAALLKAGLRPRAVVRFTPGGKNLDKEMQELKSAGADVLIGWSSGPEQGLIAASRSAVGWSVPMMAGWDASNSSAYVTSNGKVEGVMMVQTVLPNRHLERNSTFLSAYAKISKERPIGSMMSAAQTYDAVHLLMRALFAAKGDIRGPAIKSSLEDLKDAYRGVVTTYDRAFTPSDHDAISIRMLWLGTWRNGDRDYFYDEDEKRAAILRYKR